MRLLELLMNWIFPIASWSFFPLSLDSETAEADTGWSKIYRVIDKPIKCAREQITGRVVAKM